MRQPESLRRYTRYGLVVLFVAAGVLHFAVPARYEAVMPPYLPAPRLLVLASGLAEIAGGIGLLVPRTRRVAAWGLALMLLVFQLAHVHMALSPEVLPVAVPDWALWGRVALQVALIGVVLWAGLPRRARPPA